jgi:hypothetical protein
MTTPIASAGADRLPGGIEDVCIEDEPGIEEPDDQTDGAEA